MLENRLPPMLSRKETLLGEAWLNRCRVSLRRHEGELTYCGLFDPDTSKTWVAARAPIESPAACQRLERDYRIRLEPEWAILPVGFVRSAEGPLMIYPPSSGLSFMDLISAGGVPHERFLRLASNASKSLALAHDKGVTHGALQAQHIVVGDHDSVRLSCFRADTLELINLESATSDHWNYLAPEQVCPHGSLTDHRSDIYALGAALYHLLVGELPLEGRDKSHWRQLHAGVQARPPVELKAGVPSMVSDILLKALAKEPNARYQSAKALAVDFEHCLRQWSGDLPTAPFVLGTADVTSMGGEVLFGRGEEQAKVESILRVLRRDSAPRVLTVSGPAGSGKSSLVTSSLRAHTESYWAAGKCNTSDQAIPYGPWREILESLATQLLVKNSSDLDSISADLAGRLKGRGKLLAKLAPYLKLIIGPMAEFPEKPTRLALERENRAILDFLAFFGTPGKPLVIFLDDMQWADDATHCLLREYLARPLRNTLLVLALRTEDQKASQAVESSVLPLDTCSALSYHLSLPPLSVEAVKALIAQRFHAPGESVVEVARHVHEKTAGNPFFINQILKVMIEDKLVEFDSRQMGWTWSLEAVAQHRYADNVADLMIQRLRRLPPMQHEILRLIAAVGGKCDEALLAALVDLDPALLNTRLQSLSSAGFISLTPGGILFTHDRVLEAAYDLTPPAQRPKQHAEIALSMHRLWRDALAQATFEIANQVHLSEKGAYQPEQAEDFLTLLLEAAARARDTAAFEQAAGYLVSAEHVQQSSNCDDLRVKFSFAIMYQAAECDMQLSEMIKAEHKIAECMRRAGNRIERARGHKLKAKLLTLRSEYESAIDEALEGLAGLGITMRRGVLPDLVAAEHIKLQTLIDTRGLFGLESLPRIADPEAEVAIELLATLGASFFVEDDIRFLHLAKIVELSLQYGIAPGSTYGLSWYGVMIAERFGAYHDGYSCCLVALKLIERYGFEADLTGTLVALDQVSAWTAPMEYAKQKASEAFETGHLSGDLAMACYACNHLVSDSLIMGEHLQEVAKVIGRGLKVVRQYAYADVETILVAQERFVQGLSEGYSPRPMVESDCAETALYEAGHAAARSKTTLFFSSLYAGMSAFYLGNIPYAVRRFRAAQTVTWSAPAHINLSDFYLFYSLALGSPEAPGTTESKLETLHENRERFARWAALNPVTFRNKLLLIEGVIAKLNGDGLVAIRCFDQAQIAAAAAGFLHEQALAHEQLAEVCIPSGLISGANLHLRVARDCFHIWGANGKVRQLETLHPFLRIQPVQETFRSASQAHLDLKVGIEAARALSEEVLLERLIETLMSHLMQHSGADHGALLIVSGAEFQMAALADIEDDGLKVTMENCQKFLTQAPVSVLNATMRTKTNLVLHDALLECPDAFRSELQQRNARSVLCLPLIKQGVLIGLVYLENRRVPGLFGSQRLAMLEILASQAAVSLQAAKFFTRLAEDNQIKAQMEEALRRSRAELARSAHMQVMGELSASIAHEISQPLLGIASNAAASLRWLKRGTPNLDEAIAGLEDIRADSERAAGIVRALRSLAKQTNAQQKMTCLDDVIREVIRLTTSEVVRQGVKLDTHLDAPDPIMIDQVQVQQLIYNLINNGLEALSGFRTDDGTLRITSRTLDDGVEVSVDDNGPGIPADERENIFGAFYTTKDHGLGMGLAICNSVVRAHGGSLQAEHSPCGGCRIRFTLPRGNPG
ncbi:trifunctional serine/threonine-protein kinase/ATP-binding protein/sensor histidine kinase [Pseudomonas alabamensis]|uniref:trifunctional serine/threonine-protein kinase/ATP-binding protein/sensor histidine kinase n=2 Tax=Gammaproteobacteria TaxID=1236 RepID=UPI0021D92410|nr:ATP-binding sensor histidine kinase [Pseudomonas entomophila]